jgi:hypothetical protein
MFGIDFTQLPVTPLHDMPEVVIKIDSNDVCRLQLGDQQHRSLHFLQQILIIIPNYAEGVV